MAIIKRFCLAAREGLGIEARVLKHRDPDCQWTHVGLAFCSSDDRWSVVHADPGDGKNGSVRQVSIDEFCAPGVALHAEIFGLAGSNDIETANRLYALTNDCLGLPFDGGYDWTRIDAYHCTSFVWHALNRAGLAVVKPPFPTFALPLLGLRELILPSLLIPNQGDSYVRPR